MDNVNRASVKRLNYDKFDAFRSNQQKMQFEGYEFVDFDYLNGYKFIAANCPICRTTNVIKVTPMNFGKEQIEICRHYVKSDWPSQQMIFDCWF